MGIGHANTNEDGMVNFPFSFEPEQWPVIDETVVLRVGFNDTLKQAYS